MAKIKAKEIWLTPELLQWSTFASGLLPNDSTPWARTYELLGHAEKRLKEARTDDDRADVVSILRRVLNHRLEKFKSIYLKKIILPTKPKGTIEQLEFFGIAKRGMVHKLLNIRNQIEYNDKRPPKAETCAELVEFMWYFLRSTDIYISNPIDDFEMQNYDINGKTASHCSLNFGPKNNWNNSFYGWFEDVDISFEAKPNWLRLKLVDLTSAISGADSPMQLTVTNLSGTSQTGSLNVSLTDNMGNIVTNYSQSFSVNSSAGTTLDFILSGTLPPGSYALTASLNMNGGSGQVLAGVYVVPLAPVTLGFSSMPIFTTSGLNLTLQGPVGSNYLIEASSDLVNWSPTLYFSSSNSPFYFNDLTATNYNQRFYRAIL
jgi:hypothetical protein